MQEAYRYLARTTIRRSAEDSTACAIRYALLMTILAKACASQREGTSTVMRTEHYRNGQGERTTG